MNLKSPTKRFSVYCGEEGAAKPDTHWFDTLVGANICADRWKTMPGRWATIYDHQTETAWLHEVTV